MAITVPLHDAILEAPRAGQKQTGNVSWSWLQYFLKLNTRIASSPLRLRRVTTAIPLTVALATTPVPLAALAGGLYRVTTYVRITTPATVSSSLIVTIGWTDGAVACEFSGPALTGNTTFTTQSFTQMVRIDQATPLTYATAYVSVGGTPMAYDLELVVDEVVT